ncbi:hypothetical protein BH09ACT7_BH09ACT7_05040 [soil metagenome]
MAAGRHQMRSDLALDDGEVAWFVSALEELERLSARQGRPLHASVGLRKRDLVSYLASRAPGRVDTTTRPLPGLVTETDEEIDTTEAADLLGLTEGAVQKRCRPGGQFAGVARKHRGHWMIPVADVEAELGTKGAA